MENQSTMQNIAESIDTSSTACQTVGGIKLFGKLVSHGKEVQAVNSVHKSKSMEIIVSSPAGSMDRGYASSDVQLVHRKKGVPWTTDEHRAFLAGLDKIKRGHWKRISNEYVPSRTSAQVASHAQKYYLRLKATQEKPKRRSSIFDMPLINESGYKNDNEQRFSDPTRQQVLSFVPIASFPNQPRVYPLNADGPNVTQLEIEPRLRLSLCP